MRARLENIPIILGSATPSLESWHNAQRGPVHAADAAQRVLDRPLPQVRADRSAARPPPDKRPLRPSARRWNGRCSKALERRRPGDAAAQSPRLLDARPLPACGHVEQCQFCDLALTFHQRTRRRCCAITAATSRSRRSSARSAARRRCAIRAWAPRSCKRRSRRSSPTTSCGAWTATR